MADDFTWEQSGSGLVFRSDDIDGVHHQMVKVEWGEDGVANAVSEATPLPVVRSENGKTLLRTKLSLSASQTGATVLDPTTGQRFVLKRLQVQCKTAGDCYFFDHTDDAAHAVGAALAWAVGDRWEIEWGDEAPLRSAAVDNILKYTSGTGFTGVAYVEYYEES